MPARALPEFCPFCGTPIGYEEHEHQPRYRALEQAARARGDDVPRLPDRVREALAGEAFTGVCPGCRLINHVVAHRTRPAGQENGPTTNARVARVDPRLAQMRQRYLAGASMQEVARDFGISAERVRQLFRAAGLPSRSPADARLIRAEQRTARIIARVEETRDVDAVAVEFELSAQFVRQLLRRVAPDLLPPAANARVPRGYWTRDRIIDAIRSWQTLHGAPPTATDWNPAAARRHGHDAKVERFRSGLWPYVNTVMREFGGWNVAMAAASARAADEAQFDDPQSGTATQPGA